MQPMYLACLVALGASLYSACAELENIRDTEFASALDGECPASGGDFFSLLQHHARHVHASSSSSSRNDDRLLQDDYPAVRQLTGNCTRISDQCGCFEDEALTVRPSDVPTVYRSHAVWRPVPSETVFSRALQYNGLGYLFRDAAVKGMLPSVAFNPALVRLPKGVAASWHPDAYYVAIARHSAAVVVDCIERTENDLGAGFEWKGTTSSSLILLNKNLETLVIGKMPSVAQDYRLFVFKGKVLATFVNQFENRTTYEKEYFTNVFELRLNFTRDLDNEMHQCPQLLNVVLQEFKHQGATSFDHKTNSLRFFGKNIGLVSNKEDGELQIVWRLTNPVDMRNWASEAPLHTNEDAKVLRNNGSPIYLPEYDAYLAFGHTYWSGLVDLNLEPHHVRNYIHRIVLFDANPPYKWLRASDLFCFPVVSGLSQDLQPAAREEWCESIQFIMSWVREGDDILITYGVSDCEPAVAKVPLQALMAATSANFSYDPDFPHDAHAQIVHGAWNFDDNRRA